MSDSKLTPHQLRQIAAATGRDPRTVAKAYDPQRPILTSTLLHVAEAARQLSLPEPPAREAPAIT